MIRKAAPILEIKALETDGEIVGYGSTFGGDPDSYGDVVNAGAFADSLAQHAAGGTMPKMLWQHDSRCPIGKWTEASEDERGLLLKGQINMNVQQGREAHALLKAGDIDGLSIGYRLLEWSRDEDDEVWYLEKLDLREVSIVTDPANERATVQEVKAAKAVAEIKEKLAAGDRPTERELETLLKGSLGFSNSQAERAVRILLKGPGEPAIAADDRMRFLEAMRG